MSLNKHQFGLDKKHIDLSNAKQLDYNFLGQLIEKTSFIETLVLPKINSKNAEDILKILNKSTAKNTTLTKIKVNLSDVASRLPNNVLTFYDRIQSRLARNRKRIFAIHGGGNIGLGCMADIVSRSTLNYTIKATSSDHFMNTLINSAHRYCLRNSNTKNLTASIDNVHMIYSRSAENIINLYKQASLLALCLTEDALIQVAPHIAQGLIARYEFDRAELKILILMNKTNCDKYVHRHIAKALLTQTKRADYAEQILATVKFIPTVVDRIVSKISRKEVQAQIVRQLKSINELHSAKFLKHYNFLDTDKPFAKQIDAILTTPHKLTKAMIAFNLHFSLFNVEEDFTLHIPHGLPEAKRMPLMKPVKDLAQFEAIKNKFINGPHAMLAWAGGLMGCDTIAEAIKKPSLVCFVNDLMEKEIAPALKAEYPSISNAFLESLKEEFLKRCEMNISDPIARVARDPLRKLNSGGRVRGVIELCHKHHLDLPTPQLERGIAAGILYAVKNLDPDNPECEKIREIYERNHSYAAVLCYKGQYGDSPYPGFEAKKDKKIIRNILRHISLLEKTFDIQCPTHKTQSVKNILNVDKQPLSTSQILRLLQPVKQKTKSTSRSRENKRLKNTN